MGTFVEVRGGLGTPGVTGGNATPRERVQRGSEVFKMPDLAKRVVGGPETPGS